MNTVRKILVVALVAISMLLVAIPASAHTQVCAVALGVAQKTGGDNLGLPVLTNGTQTGSVAGGTQVCDDLGSVTATYTATGACGLSTGQGTINNDHDYNWTGVGTQLILTGRNDDTVVGLVNATANLLAGSSCASGTASQFLVSGAIATV